MIWKRKPTTIQTKLEQAQRAAYRRATEQRMITGAEVKGLRERFKLSQEDFCRLLGSDLRALQSWEEGKTVPRGASMVLFMLLLDEPSVPEDVHELALRGGLYEWARRGLNSLLKEGTPCRHVREALAPSEATVTVRFHDVRPPVHVRLCAACTRNVLGELES